MLNKTLYSFHIFFLFTILQSTAQDLNKQIDILNKKIELHNRKTDSLKDVIEGIERIENINKSINYHDKQTDSLRQILEELELKKTINELKSIALPKILPNEELIEHKAMLLVYSEDHEQAKWVAHKISHKIINGNIKRTNNFRKDPLIKTGSAEEKDYFLKTKNKNNSYTYDGFGYDRGHLAPSADFKWSKTALSGRSTIIV